MFCWHKFTPWKSIHKDKINHILDGQPNGYVIFETFERKCEKCGIIKYKRIQVIDARIMNQFGMIR